MTDNDNKFHDYITFPRTFKNYKWYKPLIIIVIAVVLFSIFQIVMTVLFKGIYGEAVFTQVIGGGYETLNTSDVSVYYSYLSLAIFIPILYIASKIVRDRPFSSYSSSRGGWNWKIYFKCLLIPLTLYIVFLLISSLMGNEKGGNSQVSLMAMVISLILIPVQCIAEEHVFRGFLMQTLGSWLKNPLLAIIIQAIIFAAVHSYNYLGVISVGITGIMFGWLSWRTNGLEAASAIHSINNMVSFYTVALGFASISSTLSYIDFITDILLTSISVIAVYYIGSKRRWFDEETPKIKI